MVGFFSVSGKPDELNEEQVVIRPTAQSLALSAQCILCHKPAATRRYCFKAARADPKAFPAPAL